MMLATPLTDDEDLDKAHSHLCTNVALYYTMLSSTSRRLLYKESCYDDATSVSVVVKPTIILSTTILVEILGSPGSS